MLLLSSLTKYILCRGDLFAQHASLALGLSYDTYFSGLNAGRERVKREFGVEIGWVFDIVRDIADGTERSRRAEYTTAVAIEAMHDGVVALGLGGYELGFPPAQFAPWFDKALSGRAA